MPKIKVGFIGAGRHADNVHYPSLMEIEDCELVACCDLDSNRVEQIADKYGIEHKFIDYRKMLDELEHLYRKMDLWYTRAMI